MTVKELVEALKHMDQEAEVIITVPDRDDMTIEHVYWHQREKKAVIDGIY